MATDSPEPPFDPEVVQQLQAQFLRIEPAFAAARLWDRVLTEEDRQRLGGMLEECYPRLGTVGMWMELRGVSEHRAIVEVSHELGFLDEPACRWLLREIGEQEAKPIDPERPIWDSERGELRWGGQVIRQVRILKNPSSIQQILDTFQAAGWPARIDDPLVGAVDQQRLHQAVFTLNDGLESIRFHVQEGGVAITWTLL